MKTWDNEWKVRFEALPKNRQYHTIVALKEIIKEMHEAGIPGAEIGRLMDKDHTTIVHHLCEMGYKPREEYRQKMKGYHTFMLRVEKERLARRREREKHRVEREKIRTEASRLFLERKEQLDLLKHRARELFKEGKSIRELAKTLGVPEGRVSYLVFYDRKDVPKRRRHHTPVEQYSLNNKFIKHFHSVVAASRAIGVPADRIRHAISGGRYSGVVGGFKWRRSERV